MLKYYSPDSFLSRLLPERPTFSQISPAGNSLLHPAPSGLGPAAGKAALITLLLEKGADLHAENDSALRWASEFGHLKIVELIETWKKIEK